MPLIHTFLCKEGKIVAREWEFEFNELQKFVKLTFLILSENFKKNLVTNNIVNEPSYLFSLKYKIKQNATAVNLNKSSILLGLLIGLFII